MPPKQGALSGVENYVHSKDPCDDDRRRSGNASHGVSFEDLKGSVPKPDRAGNSRQFRSHRSDVNRTRAQNHQVQPRQQPGAQQSFYDTDASSLDDTSETPSSHQIQAVQTYAAHGDVAQSHTAQPSSDAQSSEDTSVDQDDGQDEAVENHSGDQNGRVLSAKQMERMREVDLRKAQLTKGRQLPYVKGDSYPSTTSGTPSMSETDPRRPVQSRSEQATANMSLQPRRQDQVHDQQQTATLHQWPAQNGVTSRPGQNQQQPSGHPANTYIKRPDAPDQPMPQGQFVSITAAHQAIGKAKAPSADQRPREMTTSRSRQPLSTLNAQPVSMPEADRASRHAAPSGRPKVEQQLPRGQAFVERSGKAPSHPNPNLPKAISPVAQSPQSGQPHTAADMSDVQEHGEQKTPIEEQPPLKLDYGTNELFAMEYLALKSQSFDAGPQDGRLSLPGVARDDPIENQMAAVINFHPEDQHAFLTSLPIDEWEQAGEWFLGKFGETLAKLKTLRQEKRKAAHAFEQEVEARHVAVTEKRKLTEAALGDMRTSGKQILDGTPKKTKKTT